MTWRLGRALPGVERLEPDLRQANHPQCGPRRRHGAGPPHGGWQFYNLRSGDGDKIVAGTVSPAIHHGDSAGFSYFIKALRSDALNVWRIGWGSPPALQRLEIPVRPFNKPGDVPQRAPSGVSPELVHYEAIQHAAFRNGNLHVTWGTLRMNESGGACVWKDVSDPNQQCLAAIKLVRLDPLTGVNWTPVMQPQTPLRMPLDALEAEPDNARIDELRSRGSAQFCRLTTPVGADRL